jgi:hypothetical protein
VDPLTESQESWSSYHYVYGNPVSKTDPDGREPTNGPRPTSQIGNNIMSYLGGVANAVTSNALFGANRSVAGSEVAGTDKDYFNSGQTAGDVISTGLGTIGTVLSLMVAGGSVAASPETGGASLAVAGEALAAAGMSSSMAAQGLKNLLGNGKGGDIVQARDKNKLEPNKSADGDHSTFQRDDNGNVYKHQEWKANPRNPNKFDAGDRFDGGRKDGTPGVPHVNKKTGTSILTPHITQADGTARTPTPTELPNNPRF